MDTVSLRPSAVPTYLRNSDFYKSLDIQSDEEFNISNAYFKPNRMIGSDDGLRQMLSTLQFWGSKSIPTTVFEYLTMYLSDRTSAWLIEYEEAFPVLRNVKEVCRCAARHKLLIAARSESVEFFSYMIAHSGNAMSSRVLTEASAHGRLANLTIAYEILSAARSNAMAQVYYNQAAGNGHLDCMKFLYTHGCPTDNKTCTAAAAGGHLKCLKYAHENGFPWDAGTTRAAIAAGHIECAVYAHNNGCPWPKKGHLVAAEHGNLQSLKYALDRSVGRSTQVTLAACRGGQLQCLQYVVAQHFPLSAKAYAAAARGGHLDCLRFLHENKCEVKEDAFAAAMSAKQWDSLRFLITHERQSATTCVHMMIVNDCAEGLELCRNCGLTVPAAEATTTAMRNNSMACLHYLHDSGLLRWEDAAFGEPAYLRNCSEALRFAVEHDCPLTPLVTAAAAASNGAIPLLGYLRELGCPWDRSACVAAVQGSSVDTLQYLREHGCAWGAQTSVEAARLSSLCALAGIGDECLIYAVEEGCPLNVQVARILAEGQSVEMLQFVHEHGCPWDESVSTAAHPREDILAYCVDHGCPITAETMRVYNTNQEARKSTAVDAQVHDGTELG